MKRKGFPHNGKPCMKALGACQNTRNPEKTRGFLLSASQRPNH
ncbi:hypothetical protein EPYR_00583 [Erwinia pyrifoliae DSM 12163]|nr:hypothetical protein EPYR_00583 [Erwinia pyrifoliae DSM 12163]